MVYSYPLVGVGGCINDQQNAGQGCSSDTLECRRWGAAMATWNLAIAKGVLVAPPLKVPEGCCEHLNVWIWSALAIKDPKIFFSRAFGARETT